MAGGEGGDGGGSHSREIDEMPTWAVASVCGVIILISVLLEKGLHHLGEWFREWRRKAMYEALKKIKAGLENEEQRNFQSRKGRPCKLFLSAFRLSSAFRKKKKWVHRLKKSIFDEQTSKATMKWHKTAKNRKRNNTSPSGSPRAATVHPRHARF